MTAMRVVQVNLAFDPSLVEPAALLDRYHTLTGLSTALTAAGAEIVVVQRFSQRAELTRADVRYSFIADGGAPVPAPSWSDASVLHAVREQHPDVVHVNGLMFPAMVRALKKELPRASVVVQDHAGISAPGTIQRLRDASWTGLREADAWSFTAAEHARPWRDAGLVENARIFEILEASTTITPLPRAQARAMTELHGTPAMLWVGRLNDNKDPLTVLRGVDLVLENAPAARLWMIYGEATLEPEVRALIEREPRLRERVTLLGRVPHDQMPQYYSAADLFISGSHREGSGYALIEAMSCGVVPVITDIPSFRVIAGECGGRWPAGDAASLTTVLRAVLGRDLSVERQKVRARFDRHLSWRAIGQHTVAAYQSLR